MVSTAKKLSGTTQSGHTHSFATKLWGVDWDSYLPAKLTNDITVERVSYQEATAFAQIHFQEIFDFIAAEHSQKFGEAQTPALQEARRIYYENLGDFFKFTDHSTGEDIGLAVGSVLDWSSYNFRNAAILPAYQGLGLYLSFFELLCTVMRASGVRRIEGDVSPGNQHHLAIIHKMGYKITAMNVSERWGAQLHIVKYLDASDERRFVELYDGPYNSTSNHKTPSKSHGNRDGPIKKVKAK